MVERNELRDDVKAFLSSRRARISPDQAGLPSDGRRRVAGLRRSEVAALAGVSVEYYAQLERGQLGGVSDSVLHAIARALRLDDVERDHLLRLAAAADPGRQQNRRPPTPHVRSTLLQLIRQLTDVPAFIGNGRLDILAANSLGQALYAPVFAAADAPVNVARFNFLDPAAGTFWGDWEAVADDTVAMLRSEAGRDPDDRPLRALVDELSASSEQFRTRWAAQNVRLHRTGSKAIHHPIAGHLQLGYESMDLPADPGLRLIVFSAEPGSSSYDALRFLNSWTPRTAPAARAAEMH